ncbi:hypothetical protein, partial [Escherichia coli]|uniref:hypothetical protein n=1 Tax=Escherichia coli TaxID=562 RepID=UPI001BB00677
YMVRNKKCGNNQCRSLICSAMTTSITGGRFLMHYLMICSISVILLMPSPSAQPFAEHFSAK